MLSAADAELVRLDPGIPGLGMVLDPEAFTERLRESLPYLDVERVCMTYLNYQPKGRCLVGYRLQGRQGWELDATVTAYRGNDRSHLARAREQVLNAGSTGVGVILLEDCASVVSVFPRDRKLPVLARLTDSGRRERLLRELLPSRPEFRKGGIFSLAYKPERRHVAMLQARDGSRVVVKAYTAAEYTEAKSLATAFSGRGNLGVSRLLGHADRHRLLAFDWLPGRTLQGLLAGDPAPTGAVAVAGAALAVIHEQNPWRLAAHDRYQEEGGLTAVARVLRYLCPSCGERAGELADHFADRLKDAAPAPRALHGNFQPRHVLMTETTVALLDFDRACRGNPARDLGTFLAQLELMTLLGDLSGAAAAALRTALLEGYQPTPRRIAPAWIELHTAIALFRLALHPFRARQPEWPQRIAALINRCATIVRWPAALIATRVDHPKDGDTEFGIQEIIVRRPKES